MLNWIIRLFRQVNKGFDEAKEEKQLAKEGNHYTSLGGQLDLKLGAKKKILKPDRNWRPEAEIVNFEAQRRKIETMFCTVFNSIKAIVQMMQLKYGFYEDYDEIPTANDAGVSPYKGGSPHYVCESIRNTGLFPAGTYSFTDKITSKAQLIITITKEMFAKAATWKKNWDFGHQWIWPGLMGTMQDSMWNALQYSPLGAGIYAWYYDKDKKMYTKPSWAKDNHWTVIVGGEYGKHWVIYDSYIDFSGTPFKTVPWDYPFAFVKEFSLNKIDLPKKEKGQALYERIKDAEAIQVFPSGAVYEMTSLKIIHAPWWTSSKYMQEKVDRSLKQDYKLGKIVPLSEEDFGDLTNYIKLQGISLVQDKALKAKLSKLKK